MTGDNIITEVRPEIGDTTTTYRWSDSDLLTKINAGLREIWAAHPEAFSYDEDEDMVLTMPVALSATSETVPIQDEYRNVLVHFICHSVLSEEKEEAGQIAAANEHWNKFLAGMQS